MIGDPPLDAGAVHDSEILVFPGVGVTTVGDPGTVGAATGVEDAVIDGRLVPTEFTADTLKVI